MRYAVGIDIGGTTIKSALVSEQGSMLFKQQVPTPTKISDLLDTLTMLTTLTHESYDQHVVSREPDATLGETIGIATLGVVDTTKGVVIVSANKGWKDLPLKTLAQEALGAPVVIGHDVASGALGEAIFGAKHVSDHCLFMPLGTGIAVSEVKDGKTILTSPWRGEIGQIMIPDPDYSVPAALTSWRPPSHGNQDTSVEGLSSSQAGNGSVVSPVEGMSSSQDANGLVVSPVEGMSSSQDGNGLVSSQADFFANEESVSNGTKTDVPLVVAETVCSSTAIGNRYTKLVNIPGGSLLTTKEVFNRAQHDDDKLAQWVIDSAISLQADLAAQACAFTGVTTLIIGGGIVLAGDQFFKPFEQAFTERMGILPVPAITRAGLQEWAQTIGIAYQALAAEALEQGVQQ